MSVYTRLVLSSQFFALGWRLGRSRERRSIVQRTILGSALPRVAAALAVTLAFVAGPASAATPDLQHAQSVIDAHSSTPEFIPPGAPFKVKDCMPGKKLLSIPTSSAIPFVDGI